MINPVSGYQTAVDLNQGPVTPLKTQIPTPVSTAANQDQVTINGRSIFCPASGLPSRKDR